MLRIDYAFHNDRAFNRTAMQFIYIGEYLDYQNVHMHVRYGTVLDLIRVEKELRGSLI